MPITAGTRVASERPRPVPAAPWPSGPWPVAPSGPSRARSTGRPGPRGGSRRGGPTARPAGSWSSGAAPATPPGGASGHVGQTLELHVEVAHGAEQAAQPAELLPEDLGPDGQHAREQRQRGAQAAGRHPHVVQLFGILPEPGARAPCRAARRAGVGARRRRARPWWTLVDTPVGPRSGEPGISSPRASSPASNLERRAGWSPHDDAELLHDRLERVEPSGMHLDLDPAQLHGPLAVAHHDHGVVERDLRRVDAADPQREGAPAGADLEHLVEPARADDGAQPPPDRAVRAERGQAGRRAGPR